MDGKTTVIAYCADSRLLQVAGVLSAATLAVSSQLIWKHTDAYLKLLKSDGNDVTCHLL